MHIFTCSTGRCGTLFMSEVFRTLTDIPSFHEPRPFCHAETLEAVNTKVVYPKHIVKELEEKVSQVETDTKNRKYFEANQMFIKSYAELILERFRDVYCIYLYRNPLEVLASYYKKRPERWNDWFLQSRWPKNILQTSNKLPFYYNCLWQCLEVEERYRALKKHFRKTYEFDFRKINDSGEWKKLFRRFRIKHKPFDELPDVRKNDIPGEFSEIMQGIITNWDMPGEMPSVKNGNYSALRRMIDIAKNMTTSGQKELEEHAIR